MATWTETIVGEVDRYLPPSTGAWGSWTSLPSSRTIRIPNGMSTLLEVNRSEFKNFGVNKVSFTLRHSASAAVYLCFVQPSGGSANSLASASSKVVFLSDGSGSYVEDVVELEVSPILSGGDKDPFYIAFRNTGGFHDSVSFNSIDVSFLIDDTVSAPILVHPKSGDRDPYYNYRGTVFEWRVDRAKSVPASQSQLQCSYDNNNWSDPIVDEIIAYGSSNIYPGYYAVPAYTFHGGTVYWRCRAKTDYSDWGEWAYESFVAVEHTPYIKDISFSGEYSKYKDKTKPLVLSWDLNSSYNQGVTFNGADIAYSIDGTNWINLGTVQGDTSTFTIPANTFPDASNPIDPSYYINGSFPYGQIRLRVRVYNANNISGSEIAYFYTVDSPINSIDPYSPGGSADETNPIVFQFRTWNSIGTPPKKADIRWRTSVSEWQYLEYPLNAGAEGQVVYSNIEVPENTFSVDHIYYQVRAYNQNDIVGDWSQEKTFTTLDNPQVSNAIIPKNTIEDADLPILFQWSTSSSSGEASRGADLQYLLDNEVWVDLGPTVESGPQIVGNVHEYEVPGDTLPPGVIFWHVRSYNRNMIAGEWSAAVSFVARAAPTMQDIGVTTKPWAVVNWQSDDQLSFEVFVDGESLGSFFGTERQYQLPDYLSDGDHTVGVRVLGSFSLWSQILETTVSISNSPATQLTLKIKTDVDAELSWTGGSGDYYIYRDELMIGHTNEHSFVDRTAVGSHDYLVVERLASGYYNASAVLTRTPSVECQHIAALAGGEWVAIPHTLKNQSDPSYSESQGVEYNYLAGSDYPTASVGSQRNDSGSYSAVFLYTEQDEHKRFLALRGKPVIFKTPDGEVMIGILHAWERKPKLSRNKKYYTAYTFSIQRVGWGDFIDDTL